MQKVIPLAIATMCLGASSTAHGQDERSLRGRHVAVYNLVGTATLVAGSGGAVNVAVTRHGSDGGKLSIATGAIGDRETLRITYPADRIMTPNATRSLGWGSRSEIRVREDGTFNDNERGMRGDGRRVRIGDDGLDASADLTITVPRGQQLTLHLAVGAVRATNVDGVIALDVSSGDVAVTGAKGTLTVDAGSGRVEVSDADAEVRVETGSGGVRLARIAGSELRAESGSGRITAQGISARDVRIETGSGGVEATGITSRLLHIEAGSGRITAELLAQADDVSIETGSGGVTLGLPASYGAKVEVDGGNMNGVESDFPITTNRASRDALRGTIGDGRGRLRVESGSGSVRLRRM